MLSKVLCRDNIVVGEGIALCILYVSYGCLDAKRINFVFVDTTDHIDLFHYYYKRPHHSSCIIITHAVYNLI